MIRPYEYLEKPVFMGAAVPETTRRGIEKLARKNKMSLSAIMRRALQAAADGEFPIQTAGAAE